MIDWSAFTPTHALAGGALIGLAAMLLWLGSGRIAGISGIVGGLLGSGSGDDRAWRWLFVGGLIGGAAIAHLVSGGLFEPRQDYSLWLLLPGAFLVGLGTRMGSGCTSGHGVCGISRLSIRGVTATITFIATAMATVFILRHLIGVST
jgi:uncharacterized protein